MPDWVAPQVFHGIRTEVTVPESSGERLSNSGLKPMSRNFLAYILPGMTIDRYWSEAVMLKKRHVATVEPTSVPALWTNFIRFPVIVFSMPQASMMPPKTIAHIMSQTVLSMPAIPRVHISSSTEGSPVVTDTFPNMVFIMAI